MEIQVKNVTKIMKNTVILDQINLTLYGKKYTDSKARMVLEKQCSCV